MTATGFLAGCLAALLVGAGWRVALSLVRDGMSAKTLHRLAGLAFWTTAGFPLGLPCVASIAGPGIRTTWWTMAAPFLPDALPAQPWIVDLAHVGAAMLGAAGLLKLVCLGTRLHRVAIAATALRTAVPERRGVVAADVPGPMLVGYRCPVVVLPAALMVSPTPVVDALVRHELAHARRHDNWRLLAEHVAMAILPWLRPLSWIHDAMLSAREELCDADALAHADDATREAYARVLVDVLRNTVAAPVGASGMAGHLPALQRRLAAILDPDVVSPMPSRTRMCAAIVIVVAATVATGGIVHAGSAVEAIAGEYGLSMRFVAEAGHAPGTYRVTTVGGPMPATADTVPHGAPYRVEFAQETNGTWRMTMTPAGRR